MPQENIHIPGYLQLDPGHYINAIEEGRQKLLRRNPGEVALASGAVYRQDTYRGLNQSVPGVTSHAPITGTFQLTCYRHDFTVHPGEGWVYFSGTELQPPVELQIMIWHYLATADGTPMTGEWIPYRLLPDGQVFDRAFRQTAVLPACALFMEHAQAGGEKAKLFGGAEIEGKADINLLFYAFPKVPVIYRFWAADEEVKANLSIFYDSSAPHYLHTEDLAGVGIFLTRLLARETVHG